MTTGSQTDMLGRLRSLLPPSWFPNPSSGPPILTAALQAPANVLAWAYSLLFYVKAQTRILASSGAWLDLAAYDFFGASFGRTPGQSDASFAAAIVAQVFAARATRTALVTALQTATGGTLGGGSPPNRIFECWRQPDAACIGSANAGGLWRNVAGLRGSRSYPCVVFIDWHIGTATKAQIYAAIEDVRAAGLICWVNIINP